VECGARVALCARRVEPLDTLAAELRGAGGEAFTHAADLAQAGEPERFIAACCAHFGRLDVLVNNAGSTAQGPFEQANDALWEYDWQLKLMAQVRAARAALVPMRAQGGGAIVNISMAGAKAPAAASFPTSVNRAAGLAFTKALAQELGVDRIRVNAVALGWIKSLQQEKRAEQAGLAVDAHYAKLGASVPLGRLGEPDDVARVIVFLASDLASYVTGTCINVDGGKSSVL
ncbi:MAG: SDR family oxidoreductase, partial [Proteobacteria bacterium]|nr:SDR family oxidoreductase [Burkholderiales bacterium]